MKHKNEVNNYEVNTTSNVMPKEKKKLSSKHKIIIVAIIAIIITIGTAMFLAISYGTEENRYNTVKKYCNNDSFAIQTEYELDKQEHEMNVDNLVVTKMPNYNLAYVDSIGVGEYNRSFVGNNKFVADKVKKETYTIRTEVPKNKIWNKFKYVDADIEVSCVDTTAPEFIEKVDSITINKGEELDITSKFNATDLSDKVKITVDGNVDVNTVGEQVVNVYATDDSGNVAQAEVTVIINEVEKQNTENAEPTVNTNNTTTTKSNNSTSTTKSNTSSSASTKNNSQSTTRGNSTNKNNSSSSKNNNSSTTNNSSSNTTTKNNTSSGTTSTSSCANGNHSMPTGNIGKWFNSKNELNSYYLSVGKDWNDKYLAGKITFDELTKKCPEGYECWSCSNCGKWSGNFKYGS